MLNFIDKWFLTLFQKISDWIQFTFGVNNFSLAKLFLGISFFSAISEVIHSIHLIGLEFVHIFEVFLFAGATAGVWRYIKEGEWSCSSNTAFTNINVVQLFWHRILVDVITIFTLPRGLYRIITATYNSEHLLYKAVFNETWKATFFICLYFASCTPKPPKPSRLRKLIERFHWPLERKRAIA